VGQPRAGRLNDALAALAPDVIAVYGTSLIPDAALAQARRIALNLHTGISPRYRGTACTFWPIHNGEPYWVGATVHECTAAVDGGRIFATRHAPPQCGDSLHHIFARAVVAGSDAYVEVIGKALAGSIEGVPQDLSLGREYSGSARGFLSELRARRRLARMNRTWHEASPDARGRRR
jgi:methionyl-tRNA formyltransferase